MTKIKKPVIIIGLIIILLLASACSDSTQNGTPESTGTNGSSESPGTNDDSNIDWDFFNTRVTEFIDLTANGEYDEAVTIFSEAMIRGFGAQGLKDTWEIGISAAGAYIEINEIQNAEHDGYFICGVITKHENFGFGWNIVFSEAGYIEGLHTAGTIPLANLKVATDQPTTTVQREGFTDYPVIIGEGTDFPLQGIISIPDNTAGPVPAVVLVHGSGPHDMDLTIFGNKPFKNIADNLASNGIAVIRYNKRTLTHGSKMTGSWTVRDETIEDAILATELLKADARIDENQVYMIGLSLGGMLAPRIHAEGGDFAGLIIMAGSPRFLLDISRSQNILYINETMEGEEKETALTQIEELWDDQVTALVSLPDETAKNTPVEAGMSAYYFKDLYNNPIPELLENLSIPLLILQGTQDSSVLADVDFVLYNKLLAGHVNAEFILYNDLNHLFMHSTIWGVTNQQEDYAVPGSVHQQVLFDIVNWIKTR